MGRWTRTDVSAVALVTLALTSWPAAQDRPPQRDVKRAPTVGTGIITGTLVTDDASARPIRRATINLYGGDLFRGRMTVTDDAGRFRMANLPAANYSVSATKPGFVTTYHGGKRPGRGPGVPVALAEGQQVTVAMKMMRGAVVTGTITDATGRPAQQSQVQALQYQTIGGERVLRPAYGFSFLGSATDDRGVYRLFGLPPGEYLIAATVRSTTGELRATSAAEIAWARSLAQPATGATVGGVAPGPAAPARSQAVGYAPVYFPGTVDPASATTITLAAGEERTGVDITLQMVPTARIEGTVVDPEGRTAASAQVTVLPKSIVGDVFLTMPRATTSGGRFVVAGISPGTYAVTARGRGAGPAGPPAGGRGPNPPTLWAMTEITVAGEDLSNLELRLEPGVPIPGRVEFESETGQKPPAFTSVRPGLGPWQTGGGPSVSITVPSVPVDAEGKFRFPSVVPGRYQASGYFSAPTRDQTPQWVMKSVTAGGQNVTDAPLEIRPREEPPEIVITFTDKVTEISGTLFDAAGRPNSDLSIIMFPGNREFWRQGSRRIRPVRPASDGKFKLAGLPAGEYYLAAVTDYEYTDLWDASFLEQLTAGAFKITLGEGEKKVQDIRMGGS
jgi:hypothetical protein